MRERELKAWFTWKRAWIVAPNSFLDLLLPFLAPRTSSDEWSGSEYNAQINCLFNQNEKQLLESYQFEFWWLARKHNGNLRISSMAIMWMVGQLLQAFQVPCFNKDTKSLILLTFVWISRPSSFYISLHCASYDFAEIWKRQTTEKIEDHLTIPFKLKMFFFPLVNRMLQRRWELESRIVDTLTFITNGKCHLWSAMERNNARFVGYAGAGPSARSVDRVTFIIG